MCNNMFKKSVHRPQTHSVYCTHEHMSMFMISNKHTHFSNNSVLIEFPHLVRCLKKSDKECPIVYAPAMSVNSFYMIRLAWKLYSHLLFYNRV